MSSRRDVPIWSHPEPGGRKPRFSRDQIAAAALAIADAEGFEAVSMRRIAAALGAGTMTLYHYVRTKEDLVALMDDALMGEVLVPPGELPTGWREAIAAVARRTRAVFVRHPWALVSLLAAPPGPNGMRHFEQTLEAMADAPFDDREKLELVAVIDDFVFGHVLRAGAASAAVGPEAVAAARALGEARLATGEYPRTATLYRGKDPTGETAKSECRAYGGSPPSALGTQPQFFPQLAG